MNHTRAIQYCGKLNATLPLPVSLLEFEVFSNFSAPEKAWIGISDHSNSGKRENWRDIENEQPAYIKKRVWMIQIESLIKCSLDKVKS